MCRLAYVSKPFKGMRRWLADLEKSAGGDGTGFVSGGKVTKSVAMSAKQSFELIEKWPCLWHTRRVSSGPKVDELCHPFPCDDGWLVHNGHWHSGHVAAKGLEDILDMAPLSDSAYFAILVDKLGFADACKRYGPNGVWLHMDRHSKSLAVWKNGGSLWYSPKLGAWGSEPAGDGWHKVEDGWYNYGEEPEAKPEPPPRNYHMYPALSSPHTHRMPSVPSMSPLCPSKKGSLVVDPATGRLVIREK